MNLENSGKKNKAKVFDSSQTNVTIEEKSNIEELSGETKSSPDEQRLMSSVLENDQDTIDDGKVIAESISQGLGGFTPDIMFNNLVNDFQKAKKLYGETIIREVTDFDQDYVEKNLNIPEFKSTLKQNIDRNIAELKDKKLIDREGQITKQGLKLASLILYTEELDKLKTKGLGDHEERRISQYGDKKDYLPFTRGTRYRDVSLKHSIRRALRRKHTRLQKEDLSIFERKRHGKISIIYALDASGSMRGKKLSTAKKAGIALSFRAIEEKNRAGLIVFSSKIEETVEPTTDFMNILIELTSVKARKETDLKLALEKALELFPRSAETKHLILLSDGLPTRGTNPKHETLKAASIARSEGVTISMIGIDLDKDGETLGKDICTIGEGRLYKVKSLEDIDSIILQEYEEIAN